MISAPPRSRGIPSTPVDLGLLALATALMAKLTWLTWPDVIVDFGRELYVPWRLVEGDVLYRDLAVFNGPLSATLNAAWMHVFGVGLRTLIGANLAIAYGTAILLYLVAAPRFGRRAALFGALTLPGLFAFGQYTAIGNYNWVCPYSHEMTHGIALSLLALLVLDRRRTPSGRFVAGLCLGLVLLTKVEIALAAFVSMGLPLVLALLTDPAERATRRRSAVLFFGGALLPLAVATAVLGLAMPLSTAGRGALGSIFWAFHREHAGLRFFSVGMGTEEPWTQLGRQLVALGAYALALGPAVLLGRWWRRGVRMRSAAVALLALEAALLTTHLLGVHRDFDTLAPTVRLLATLTDGLAVKQVARPWPLILAAVVVLCGVRARRSGDPRRWTDLSAALFALLMLAKMLLNPRIGHYGFGLALPAGVVITVLAIGWLPDRLASAGGDGRAPRIAAILAWALVVGTHIGVTQLRVAPKQVPVGEGPDRFLADERGRVVREALQAIRSHGDDGTLTTLPDGEMLGYLARRRNPARFGNFVPATMLLYGEGAMRADLEAAAPDLVALVHKDTSEYGSRFFGRDYGRELASWIDANYRPLHAAGDPVFREGTDFGILLLERRTPPAPSGAVGAASVAGPRGSHDVLSGQRGRHRRSPAVRRPRVPLAGSHPTPLRAVVPTPVPRQEISHAPDPFALRPALRPAAPRRLRPAAF